LAATRPTAVNLAWALARVQAAALRADSADGVRAAVMAEADRIASEDLEACRRIGANGAPLIPEGATVLTHCNAGGLATSGYGTAREGKGDGSNRFGSHGLPLAGAALGIPFSGAAGIPTFSLGVPSGDGSTFAACPAAEVGVWRC